MATKSPKRFILYRGIPGLLLPDMAQESKGGWLGSVRRKSPSDFWNRRGENFDDGATGLYTLCPAGAIAPAAGVWTFLNPFGISLNAQTSAAVVIASAT